MKIDFKKFKKSLLCLCAAFCCFSIIMLTTSACSGGSGTTGSTSSSGSSSQNSGSGSSNNNSSNGNSSNSSKSQSDFKIEGKWKSVGDWGVGQAQPGSIVTFDGKNCNLVSPNDTYAFYKQGNGYILDATTALFSQNSSFNVKIVDNNNIELTSGGNTTKLQRVG